jgi:hypothetical protein
VKRKNDQNTARIGLTSSKLDLKAKQQSSPWNVPGGGGRGAFPSKVPPLLMIFVPLTPPHFAGARIIVPPSTPPSLRPFAPAYGVSISQTKWYVPFKSRSRTIIPLAIAQITALSHDSSLVLSETIWAHIHRGKSCRRASANISTRFPIGLLRVRAVA